MCENMSVKGKLEFHLICSIRKDKSEYPQSKISISKNSSSIKTFFFFGEVIQDFCWRNICPEFCEPIPFHLTWNTKSKYINIKINWLLKVRFTRWCLILKYQINTNIFKENAKTFTTICYFGTSSLEKKVINKLIYVLPYCVKGPTSIPQYPKTVGAGKPPIASPTVMTEQSLETKETKLAGSFLLECLKVLIDDCYCK